MRAFLRFVPAVVAVLLSTGAGAEPAPTPAVDGPASSDAPPASAAELPRANLDGDPPPEAVAVPQHPRPGGGDPRTLRERLQRQKIERAANLAADDLAWVREQRAALAGASGEGETDPRDRELEKTEDALLRRIAVYRARFGEITESLRKTHDGELPAEWNPELDCPACP